MAVTKRFAVGFETTFVVDTETETAIKERVKALAHMVKANDPEVTPQEREMLVQALTHGIDGVVSFVVKQSLRDFIKELGDEHRSEGFKFSPATIRTIK